MMIVHTNGIWMEFANKKETKKLNCLLIRRRMVPGSSGESPSVIVGESQRSCVLEIVIHTENGREHADRFEWEWKATEMVDMGLQNTNWCVN